MQGGESSEDHGRGVESGRVQIDAEEGIDSLETSCVTGNRVVGRCEAVGVLVPGRRAGEDDLDDDGGHVHVAESACPGGGSARRAPNKHASANNDGRNVVDHAVGDPSQDIQDSVLVGGHDVAEVGAVEDVLEGREHTHPDGGSVVGRDIPGGKVSMSGREWWHDVCIRNRRNDAQNADVA